MYTKILVPTDGSPGAIAAIRFARDLLISGVGQSLTLVHIASIAKELSDFSIVNTKMVDEELVKSKLLHHGHDLLVRQRKLIQSPGLMIDTLVELADDPGETIVQLAQEQDFSLIVMGNRGLSLVKELILGSVSSKVLHHAKCPVVIFKG